MFIGERERERERVTYDTVDTVGRIQNKKILSRRFPHGTPSDSWKVHVWIQRRRQYRWLRLRLALFSLFALVYKTLFGRMRRVECNRLNGCCEKQPLTTSRYSREKHAKRGRLFSTFKSSGSYRFSRHSFATTWQKKALHPCFIGHVAYSRVFRDVTRISRGVTPRRNLHHVYLNMIIQSTYVFKGCQKCSKYRYLCTTQGFWCTD